MNRKNSLEIAKKIYLEFFATHTSERNDFEDWLEEQMEQEPDNESDTLWD